MSKGNEFSRRGGTDGRKGRVEGGRCTWSRSRELYMPQSGSRSSVPTEDNLTIVENGDGRGGKGDGAAGITELAHG